MHTITKKISMFVCFLSLIFVGCSNQAKHIDSTSHANDTYVGGDETSSPKYVYVDSGVLASSHLLLNGNQTLPVVINPQRLPNPTALDTSTRIFNVDIDIFHQSSSYKNGIECIVYTPDFYFSYTNATDEYDEVVAEYDTSINRYCVTQIHTSGHSYIPLNGIVVAIPKSNPQKNITITNPFQIGSYVNFETGIQISRYAYAITNQENIRLPFSKINEYREDKEVVLFSREYGSYTKTNAYGAEIYVDYDLKNHSYYVAGFRGYAKELGNLNEDPRHYGGKIPEMGFVISAQSNAISFETYREGRKLIKGDQIRFENYALYTYQEDVVFNKNIVDNAAVRSTTSINKVTRDAPFLDEYGYTNYGLWSAYELAVKEMGEYGLVVAMDREVGCPEEGYLLSCEGAIASQLQKVVQLGSLVKIDGNKIHIMNDVGLNQSIELFYYENILETKLLEGKENFYDYDYDTLQTNYAMLKQYNQEIMNLKKNINQTTDLKRIQTYAIQIMQKMNLATECYWKAYASATESRYVDGRAAWLFGTNTKSLKEIQDMIQHYKNANINLIYLCIFDGTTYFESKMVPYNQNYVGDFGEYGKNNFLGAFIGEAHKAGIQVHGWTTNFHVGNVGDPNVLFNQHKDWQQVYYDGKVDSEDEMTEQTLLYFDPANPEVQDFLIDFYKEVLDQFALDGLHLDYIRYAAGNDVTSLNSAYCKIQSGGKLYADQCLNRTQGYTSYAMSAFKKEYGLDASVDVKEYVKEVSNYLKWSEFRTQVITQFVQRVHDELTQPRNTFLSIAVVPEIDFAKANKMQDWSTWVQNGWIDMVNGMYYSTDPNRTLISASKVQPIEENKVYDYPGILVASYYSLPCIQNLYYYQAAHETFQLGAAIFDANAIYSYQRLIYSDSNLDLEYLLKNGPHRHEAVLPNDSLDHIVPAFIQNISDRIDTLYLKNQGMNATQKQQLLAKLKALSQSDAQVLLNQLTLLKNELGAYGNPVVVDRISEYIDVMIHICHIKIERNKDHI